MNTQLALGFTLRDDATFDSFYIGDNAELYDSVVATAQGRGESLIYIWGPKGCGKTHLLQAACHVSPEFNQTTMYLPDPLNIDAEQLAGLEHLQLVCIDNLEPQAPDQAWEENLLHWFNRARQQGCRLIIAASEPPSQLKIQLPDLRSRLSWGITYQMHALSDSEKLSALQLRARGRGLDLDDAAGRFLLSRCPRNMIKLFQALNQLDQASFAAKRKLTIPFIKSVLNI